MKIESIKEYLDEHKQEIDINIIKEYLDTFGIKIFDSSIKDIEKQLSAGSPKTFEEELELLFREKAFACYGGNIYEVPRYVNTKIDKL